MRLDDNLFYLMSGVIEGYYFGVGEDFQAHGISRSEWRCLAVLHDRKGCTVNELARLSHQPQTTVSRVVDRKEQEGLMERRPRAGDGRIVDVYITRAGERKLAELLPIIELQRQRALHGVGQAESNALRTTLRKLLNNLNSPFFALQPASGGGKPVVAAAARTTRPKAGTGAAKKTSRPRKTRKPVS